jgi:hypothetical protein
LRLGFVFHLSLACRTVVLKFTFEETSMLSIAQIAARILHVTQTAWSLLPGQVKKHRAKAVTYRR